MERERQMMTGQHDVNMKEMLSVMAQEWHALPEEQKQLYRDESN